ncbi:uncharacterized protein LOC130894104 [Diorhabda carinulata]|uniref:uncharacterized protein LOC130894104 n=1 Tax=Diorhabda carinulata TaxID=1163345 RepID=UPI0025A132BE|nr:uncharacterized protein LOC130894104 [Diorhabda carinulata]
MTKFVIIFACLALFEAASALQCYKCDNCQGSPSSWEKINCGNAQSNVPPFTEHACATIKYKDRVTYKDAVQKKCVLAEKKNGKLSFNCPTSMGEPSECPVCQTDLCNSATTIKYSFMTFVSVVLAVILPKYL